MSSPSFGPELWRELESTPPAYGAMRARRLLDSDLVLAVDHDRRHHLLLPIASEEEGFTDSRSRGLLVAPRSLEVEDDPPRPFLDLCCSDRTANEAFNLIAESLVEELAKHGGPVEAVRTTLARWRRFWANLPIEGLTPEEVRGLFGELWFLLVWLLPHGARAIEHWVGPAGARSDFQWPRLSVEVKTTISVRGHVHRINGIDQLDAPDDGALHVFSLRVREEPASTNSLTTLVAQIEDRLAEDPEHLDLFDGRLAAVGYSPAHADRYRDLRFRVVDERLYRVAEDFPRLSVASLTHGVPPGVERIEYEINLEGVAHLIVATGAAGFSPPTA